MPGCPSPVLMQALQVAHDRAGGRAGASALCFSLPFGMVGTPGLGNTMAFIDMPLVELWRYRPERDEPADFDEFWARSLHMARTYDLGLEVAPVDYGLALVDAFDVTFNGYAGQPVKGWLLLPKHRTAALPCVVQYIGYGGGRGLPYEWLPWVNLGYATLIMDTRGQGSVWRAGNTPDFESDGFSPQAPGFMTRGILSPDTYYYRRVMVDAVRAVEAARAHDAVDATQIIVTGESQGGGLTLAVAGLVPDLKAAMPEVPFLCHYRRATQISNRLPYSEIATYLSVHRDRVEEVFLTLAYFDGVNFAARATAPALFSVGLMDETCPPSTVFAAYNHYAAEKRIEVYEYNDHEGGGAHHLVTQVQWLQEQGRRG